MAGADYFIKSGQFGNFDLALERVFRPAGVEHPTTSEYFLLLKLRVEGDAREQKILLPMNQLQRLNLEEHAAGCLYITSRAKKQVREIVRAAAIQHLGTGQAALCFPQSGWYALPDGKRIFAAGDELLPAAPDQAAEEFLTVCHTGTRLAAPGDQTLDVTAQEFLTSLQKHLCYRLPVFGYAIFSAHRSLWKESDLPFACALFIVGKSGTGKTTLARNFCQLYDRNGIPEEFPDAESTTPSLGEILHRTRDRTVLYDDICRSTDTENQRKRLDNGVKAVRYVANESGRMKMSGIDPQSHPCQAGLVLTAEILPQELSEITRCLLVQVHDYRIGGTSRDRQLAAGMLRAYLSWFAEHCEEELENLRSAKAGFPTTPYPDVERLWTSFLQIDWCLESFLRFLNTIGPCRDRIPELKQSFEQCLMAVFDEELGVIRRRQEQNRPVEEQILQGVRTGVIPGFRYKGYFCVKFDDMMAYLRKCNPQISERNVSKYLRMNQLVSVDSSNRVSKKVEGIRWVFLNAKFFQRAGA
ncbi:ATP-binding protein [Pseudoflavonifractor phocaeensis]|uniref:ATP-binding protein n=1 Tax=Pseudoflavonifractor phocaeensis TaxID=1870988 RepID=UPI001F416632|nr:ATP-binding protein [Pseudoflavonifractor phocaeensis]MCF2661501.1 ATP-binding protein [Pseudoflavonifractor phocaeensis]